MFKFFRLVCRKNSISLSLNPDNASYLPYVLLSQSRFLRARTTDSLPDGKRLPVGTTAPLPFTNGTLLTVQQYQDAIDLLADDPRIDLVLASIEPGRSNDDTRTIHQALVAHAVALADNGAPRIAFGSVTSAEQPDLGLIRDHAATVRNRRFVLVSPSGAEGAVAGLVGRLNQQDSLRSSLYLCLEFPPRTTAKVNSIGSWVRPPTCA